jgi:PAS domain S-box-containing protein
MVVPMMSLEEAYQRTTNEERERSFVITDPRLEDNPIVFTNDAFRSLTGYNSDEVLGRNCRFLQGKDTDPETVRALHEAIARSEEMTIDILNYAKDGSSFWNRLRIRPNFSESGAIEYFLGLQNPIDPSEVRNGPLRGFHD